ncbi:MAG: diacylglycerol kinase family protein [Candidatus Dormibacteria bacterium]
MSARETLVIVNPTSAGGRTAREWSRTAARLRAHGVDFDVHMTKAPDDATRAVRAALREGVKRIVSVGGDGTLNEVVNGFFDEDGTLLGGSPVLAVIPSGTGGDFRRSAGIPLKPDASVQLLTTTKPRRVDAGCVEYADGSRRYFINVAGCGIDGDVVARVNRSRHKGGGLRGSAVFFWQSLAAVMTFGGRRVRLTVDDTRFERTV